MNLGKKKPAAPDRSGDEPGKGIPLSMIIFILVFSALLMILIYLEPN